MMRKKALLILTLLISLFGGGIAYAKYGIEDTQKATCTNPNNQGTCTLPTTVMGGANTVEGVVGGVVEIVLSILGIVFFILIFYSGFNWMTARGNSEKVEKSKETIEAAAIGLIIVLAAYAITNFVFDNLAGSGTDAGGNTAGCCMQQDGSGNAFCTQLDSTTCSAASGLYAPGTCQPDNTCR